ncbi:MAG: ATP-binding cassette domain-containing protein, partial [Candidatus Thermoplasmatota archaeon]
SQLIIVESRSCYNVLKELTTICANLFRVGVHTAFMLMISWPLTALFFLFGLGAWAITTRLNRLNRRWSKAALTARNDLMAVTQDALYGVKQVKLLSYEGRMVDFLRKFAGESMRYFARSGVLASAQATIMQLCGLVAVTAIIAAAAYLPGAPPVGGVILFLFIAVGIVTPASATAREVGILTESLPAVRSVMRFLGLEERLRERDGRVEREQLLADRLVFERVCLDYEGRPGILRDISLEIRRGESVGIAGGSGAGKTSLVNLIPRLYDPVSGRIVIDGVDLREFRLWFLRGRIGMLSQDVFVFNATVRENIMMGRPDATEAEMIEAARLAHAHEFITALPHGYDTVLGDRGVKLSGGQRQRINIAQVFLKNPEILILDEATSALDSESEALVQDAIERLSADRTVILIAHRLSTLRKA